MKKVEVVKKVIVNNTEPVKVTPEFIDKETAGILAEKVFETFRDHFFIEKTMDEFEDVIEKMFSLANKGDYMLIGGIYSLSLNFDEEWIAKLIMAFTFENDERAEMFRREFIDYAISYLFFEEEEDEENDDSDCDKHEGHCRGCMGACFGDCECCRHMKAGADDE